MSNSTLHTEQNFNANANSLAEKEVITLHHGNGGRQMQELLHQHLFPLLGDATAGQDDAAVVALPPASPAWAMTTDSFVVDPLFFPGGDIGRLAICGTVNDLATSGAVVAGVSLGLILEEGLPLKVLDQVMHSLAATAQEAQVKIITGDTKVVAHGQADGIFINTAAVGFLGERVLDSHGQRRLSTAAARPSDEVIITGPIGNHELALRQTRHLLNLEPTILSDVAPLNLKVQQLINKLPPGDLHVVKDPTRGGVATALTEIAQASQMEIVLNGEVELDPPVAAACDLLGLDPWYLANEGKYLLIGRPGLMEAVLEFWPQARLIGHVQAGTTTGKVFLTTPAGSLRRLLPLETTQVPRIC